MIYSQSYIYNRLTIIIILLLLFFLFLLYDDKFKNKINIPELLFLNSQRLQIYIPSKKCKKTLYFSPEYRENNDSIKTNKITKLLIG